MTSYIHTLNNHSNALTPPPSPSLPPSLPLLSLSVHVGGRSYDILAYRPHHRQYTNLHENGKQLSGTIHSQCVVYCNMHTTHPLYPLNTYCLSPLHTLITSITTSSNIPHIISLLHLTYPTIHPLTPLPPPHLPPFSPLPPLTPLLSPPHLPPFSSPSPHLPPWLLFLLSVARLSPYSRGGQRVVQHIPAHLGATTTTATTPTVSKQSTTTATATTATATTATTTTGNNQSILTFAFVIDGGGEEERAVFAAMAGTSTSTEQYS